MYWIIQRSPMILNRRNILVIYVLSENMFFMRQKSKKQFLSIELHRHVSLIISNYSTFHKPPTIRKVCALWLPTLFYYSELSPSIAVSHVENPKNLSPYFFNTAPSFYFSSRVSERLATRFCSLTVAFKEITIDEGRSR